MRWMILGGSGQLGREMSLMLSKLEVPHVTLNHSDFDITNPNDIQREYSRYKPDVVLNAAAWTNVELAESNFDDAFRVNAIGPMLLAKACSASGIRFIHISTDYVFSGDRTKPWDEDSQKLPISNYGKTKSLGEDLVSEFYPEGSIILRTSWLYSPWGRNFVKTIAKIAIQETSDVKVICDQIGQPTSARDLARHINDIMSSNITPGVYHASNGGETTWYEFAKEIFRGIEKSTSRVIPIKTLDFEGSVSRPTYSSLGHEKWATEGLQPMRHWQLALKDSLPFIIETIE